MKKFSIILLLTSIILGSTGVAYAVDKDDKDSLQDIVSRVVSAPNEGLKTSSSQKQDSEEAKNDDKKAEENKDNDKQAETNEQEKSVKGNWDEVTPTNFNIKDWTYEIKTVTDDGHSDNGNSDKKQVIVLKKYNGNLKNIEIPGLYDKKEVWLDDTNNGVNILPNDVESVKFVSQTYGTAKVWAFNTVSLFKNKTKLKSVDLDGLEFLKITSMAEMFKNCTSLESVDLSFKGTYNVVSMASMFDGCTNLKDVNLEFMETGSLENINKMFYGCSSLNWLDLSNFSLANVKYMNLPFYTEEKTPFLVLSGEQNYAKLKSIDYDKNNRIVPGPWFDPNGGTINGKSDIIPYFESCVIKTRDELDLSRLQAKVESLKPEKTGGIFEGWNIINEPSNPSTILDFGETTYQAKWQITKPNTSEDNTVFDPKDGKISFAYVPTKFDLGGPQRLGDSGSAEYPFQRSNTFNVGVYYFANPTPWNVQTYLQWTGSAIPSAVVKTYSTGKAMVNNNNGSNPYDPSKDLTAARTSVRGPKDLEINTDSQIIMKNTSTTTPQGVYDMDLGAVSLVLNDTKAVMPGEYSANVIWNLVQAP